MKALKITIIALLAGFSMVSCDFLDKEPTKLTPENYFNTPAEANSFLTGIYAILSQPTFYGGDYMYLVAGDALEPQGPDSLYHICLLSAIPAESAGRTGNRSAGSAHPQWC